MGEVVSRTERCSKELRIEVKMETAGLPQSQATGCMGSRANEQLICFKYMPCQMGRLSKNWNGQRTG